LIEAPRKFRTKCGGAATSSRAEPAYNAIQQDSRIEGWASSCIGGSQGSYRQRWSFPRRQPWLPTFCLRLRRLSQLRRALTTRGRLVIVGGETDGRWLGGFDRQIRAHLFSLVVSQNLGMLTSSENSADLVVLRELIESGKVTPIIDKTYPLGDVAVAIRYMSDGHARGKVVISV